MVAFDNRNVNVHVDLGSPTAWRNEPYYSQLKRWSWEAATRQGNVLVRIGRRVIVVLPQGGGTDLGIVAEDERILTRALPSFSGKRLEVIKVKQDDLRLGGQGDALPTVLRPRAF